MHLHVPEGSKLTLTASGDNKTPSSDRNGVAMFVALPAQCYVDGIKNDPVSTPGEAGHFDTRPSPLHAKLADLGIGFSKASFEGGMLSTRIIAPCRLSVSTA